MAILTHPNHTRIAATAALLIMTLGWSGATIPAFADEYSASPETEAALADAQAQADAAQQQINALNNAFYEAQTAYDQTTAELEATNQAIADLQVTIDEKQVELAEAQDALANRMSAEYTAGPTGLLDVILSAEDFNDFVNRLYYAGKLTDADAQAIQQVKDLKASLQASQDELVVQQQAQQELQAQQEQDLASLNDQLAAAQEYKASLDAQVADLLAQRQAEIDAQAQAAAEAAAAQAAAAAASGMPGTSVGGVVDAALQYLGSPYVWGAEGPGAYDCSGLTTVAYRAMGIEIPHQSGSQYAIVAGNGHLVGAGGLNAGDLVFFGYYGSDAVCHVGIYMGGGMVVHSLPASGVTTESLSSISSYLNFLGGGSPV
ncbi:MAG: C40 family peptidase [Coriobacteriia bacterium]|nr:C40 family peptidase [Coriobacteriia bacterium]MBS5477963.1 C40 family peptidase [Coriobacteriia bacterium]